MGGSSAAAWVSGVGSLAAVVSAVGIAIWSSTRDKDRRYREEAKSREAEARSIIFDFDEFSPQGVYGTDNRRAFAWAAKVGNFGHRPISNVVLFFAWADGAPIVGTIDDRENTVGFDGSDFVDFFSLFLYPTQVEAHTQVPRFVANDSLRLTHVEQMGVRFLDIYGDAWQSGRAPNSGVLKVKRLSNTSRFWRTEHT